MFDAVWPQAESATLFTACKPRVWCDTVRLSVIDNESREDTMPRATKIVSTLGPSSTLDVLERMLRAGVDVVRLNFSHGKAQDHIDRAELVREAARRVGKVVAIMADLQGPKIRVGKVCRWQVMLEAGQPFVLDASRTEPGDIHGVGLDYKELPAM